MPGEFYDIDKLNADKSAFQAQKNANTQAIADLTEQNAQLDNNITQIDSLLDAISANYPTIPTLGSIASLTITQTDTDSIGIDWADLTNATGYIVEQSINADFSNATEVYNNTTSGCTINGLTTGITYFYRVKGYADGYVDSPWATDSIVMLSQLDISMSNFAAATGSSSGEIDLNWDNVVGATSYDIYRNTVNTFGTATLVTNVSILAYTDTGLTTGALYYYWLVAKASNYLDSGTATDNAAAA